SEDGHGVHGKTVGVVRVPAKRLSGYQEASLLGGGCWRESGGTWRSSPFQWPAAAVSVEATKDERIGPVMRAQIVLFDGFDPLDVMARYEGLSAGGMLTAGAVEVELVSAEGVRPVPSGVGTLCLHATARLDPQRADLVVVPGAAGRLPDQDEATEDD